MSNGADSLEADAVALLATLIAIPSINPAFRTPDARRNGSEKRQWPRMSPRGSATMASMCSWTRYSRPSQRDRATVRRRRAETFVGGTSRYGAGHRHEHRAVPPGIA